MARKKARRTRSPHPGVKLVARDRGDGVTHYARFKDPDSGKWTDVNLARLGLSSEPARVDWAKRKSASLAKRRADLAAGAPRATGLKLAAALSDYRAHVAATKREATLAATDSGLYRFSTWAQRVGLERVEDVTPAMLARFREDLSAASLHPARGKGKLAAQSIKTYLGLASTMLNHLRRTGRLPMIPSAETIKDALRPPRVERREPRILRPADVRPFLEAVMADEDDANARGYPGLSALVAFLMLTGCRVGEALALEWSSVDLDAKDDNGQAVGVVRFRAETVKTKQWREVDLAPCPSLRALLVAMREGRATTTGAPPAGRVFDDMQERVVDAAWRRLNLTHQPKTSPHVMRRTCGSYLTCAPGIFGAASAFMSARRLGHSVTIAERSYVGTIRGLPREARTLEAVYGAEDLFQRIVDRTVGAQTRAGRNRGVAS